MLIDMGYKMQYSVQYMGKLTIYVPGMKLKVIDSYCTLNKVNRSELMTNCTMSFINSRSTKKTYCDKCRRNPAVGKYKLTVYDWEAGEGNKEMNLCQFCLNKAKQEGVSIKDAE